MCGFRFLTFLTCNLDRNNLNKREIIIIYVDLNISSFLFDMKGGHAEIGEENRA